MNLERLKLNLRRKGFQVQTLDNRDYVGDRDRYSLHARAHDLVQQVKYGFYNTVNPHSPSINPLFSFITNELLHRDMDIVQRENDRNLVSLDKDSRLVFLLNGLTLDGRIFSRLRRQLEQEGIKTLALEYDDRAPFKEYCLETGDKIKSLTKSIPCQATAYLGHSTGADILRYLALTSEKRDVLLDSPLLLAAPCTNGKRQDLKDKLILGNKEDYCNFALRESHETIQLLQKKVKNALTLACSRDRFVPLASAIDTQGLNLIIGNYGHLAMTGCNIRFNQLYIEVINSLFEEKNDKK